MSKTEVLDVLGKPRRETFYFNEQGEPLELFIYGDEPTPGNVDSQFSVVFRSRRVVAWGTNMHAPSLRPRPTSATQLDSDALLSPAKHKKSKTPAESRREAATLAEVIMTLPSECNVNHFDPAVVDEFIGFLSLPFDQCGPCRVYYPHFEWLARQSGLYDRTKTGFGLIKYSEYPAFTDGLFQAHGVGGFPTCFLAQKNPRGEWNVATLDVHPGRPYAILKATREILRGEPALAPVYDPFLVEYRLNETPVLLDILAHGWQGQIRSVDDQKGTFAVAWNLSDPEQLLTAWQFDVPADPTFLGRNRYCLSDVSLMIRLRQAVPTGFAKYWLGLQEYVRRSVDGTADAWEFSSFTHPDLKARLKEWADQTGKTVRFRADDRKSLRSRIESLDWLPPAERFYAMDRHDAVFVASSFNQRDFTLAIPWNTPAPVLRSMLDERESVLVCTREPPGDVNAFVLRQIAQRSEPPGLQCFVLLPLEVNLGPSCTGITEIVHSDGADSGHTVFCYAGGLMTRSFRSLSDPDLYRDGDPRSHVLIAGAFSR